MKKCRVLAIIISLVLFFPHLTDVKSSAHIIKGLNTVTITYKTSITSERTRDKRILDFVSARKGSDETKLLSDTPESTVTENINTAEMYKSIDLSETQLQYLANTVMHEIGNATDEFSSDKMKCPIQNVVCVILNRVLSQTSDFKNMNSIQDVVSAPNQFTGITPYLERTDYANQNVYKAIKAVLEKGDITGGALYFHSGAATGFFKSNTIQFLYKDCAGHSFYKNK